MSLVTRLMLFGLVLSAGCAPTSSSSVAAFSRRLAEHGTMTFRSHNGIAYRRDSDTELIFYPNGDSTLLDWGIAGEGFRGKFHVHDDGCMTAWYEDYRAEWPTMVIERRDGVFYLRPLHSPHGMIDLDPGASTRPAELNYWQFKMLSGSDELSVLQTAKRWVDR